MKSVRYFLVLLALIIASQPAQAHAQDRPLSDPVTRNHFCADNFGPMALWQQCHDLWPYAETKTPSPDGTWMQCERASTNGRTVDDAAMAACLLQHMDK